MSYSYYDFNNPRVIVEIDCGLDDCKTTARVPAKLKGHIAEGGGIDIIYEYSAPPGWTYNKRQQRYCCALHNED